MNRMTNNTQLWLNYRIQPFANTPFCTSCRWISSTDFAKVCFESSKVHFVPLYNWVAFLYTSIINYCIESVDTFIEWKNKEPLRDWSKKKTILHTRKSCSHNLSWAANAWINWTKWLGFSTFNGVSKFSLWLPLLSRDFYSNLTSAPCTHSCNCLQHFKQNLVPYDVL